MAITTSMVKELRAITNAGMLDCKNALIEADGDIDKAIEILREKGQSKVVKKSSRIAAEGLVYALIDEETKRSTIVEINCETDFVANTDKFKDFCNEIAMQIVKTNPEYVRAEEAPEGYAGVTLMDSKMYNNESKTVSDMVSDATVSIGEKISIRRFVIYSAEQGLVDAYIHLGGKIGVLVQLSCGEGCTNCCGDNVKTLAHDIAMHIAASKPSYIRSSEVPQAEIDHEREILKVQAANENKPANIIEKMVDGRIKKFFAEICLLDQPFVKDPEITVAQLIKNTGKDLDVVRFTRYECGEGIERKACDLAAEVAAVTQGK